LAEESRRERSEREQMVKERDVQIQEQLERCGALANALASAETRVVRMQEEHKRQQADWLKTRDELGGRLGTLEQELKRLVEVANHASGLLHSDISVEPLDLNQTVTQLASTLKEMAGSRAELLTILSAKAPFIPLSPPVVEQLAASMVKQMSDSLPLGGTITVETVLSDPETGSDSKPSALLAVTGSGSVVQPPDGTADLDSIVAQCGGKLNVTGNSETGITLEVALPATLV